MKLNRMIVQRGVELEVVAWEPAVVDDVVAERHDHIGDGLEGWLVLGMLRRCPGKYTSK